MMKLAAQMMLAASYAGIGFGNAGVHLPHGMSYPVSGMVREFPPPGYGAHHPLVPHGMSVILNAPAVFRFTAQANPDRHLRAAESWGGHLTRRARRRRQDSQRTIIRIMHRLKVPNGLRAIGYTSADVPALFKEHFHNIASRNCRRARPENRTLQPCLKMQCRPGKRQL